MNAGRRLNVTKSSTTWNFNFSVLMSTGVETTQLHLFIIILFDFVPRQKNIENRTENTIFNKATEQL